MSVRLHYPVNHDVSVNAHAMRKEPELAIADEVVVDVSAGEHIAPDIVSAGL